MRSAILILEWWVSQDKKKGRHKGRAPALTWSGEAEALSEQDGDIIGRSPFTLYHIGPGKTRENGGIKKEEHRSLENHD